MGLDTVRWLVRSASNYPEILAAQAPVDLLAEQEQAKLATLNVNKRRRDWLLGRLTAKQLLQTVLHDAEGIVLRQDQIVIDNDPDGAPFAALLNDVGSNIERLPWSLSISHSNGAAYSAVHPTAIVGADMERIEPRAWNFVRSYFSSTEIDLVESLVGEERDLLITAIWSGKEAVLKVLREGLRLDTRTITCLFDVSLASTTAWVPYAIGSQVYLSTPSEQWSGWWRCWQGEFPFVLTLAVKNA